MCCPRQRARNISGVDFAGRIDREPRPGNLLDQFGSFNSLETSPVVFDLLLFRYKKPFQQSMLSDVSLRSMCSAGV